MKSQANIYNYKNFKFQSGSVGQNINSIGWFIFQKSLKMPIVFHKNLPLSIGLFGFSLDVNVHPYSFLYLTQLPNHTSLLKKIIFNIFLTTEYEFTIECIYVKIGENN